MSVSVPPSTLPSTQRGLEVPTGNRALSRTFPCQQIGTVTSAFQAAAKLKMITFPLTRAGHIALQEELNRRLRVDRPALADRIQEAIADDPNLAENSEYQAALADQQLNEACILELENQLLRAEVIDVSKLSGDQIKFGATVTLIDEDTKEKSVWQIVGKV